MYCISKLAQAAGLTILLFSFFTNFPSLMSYKALGLGIGLFMFGWFMNRFLLKT